MPDKASDDYVLRGKTKHFEVAYLASLGSDGIRITDAILISCESALARMNEWFSGIAPDSLVFEVHLTDGKSGASHPSCASGLISVGARSAPVDQLDFMRNLLFAEVAEVLMHLQNKGWDCGASNGEALSRVLAADLCLGARPLPSAFQTAPQWLRSRSQNWIDRTEFTDQDPIANGCGVLFLNWLRFAQSYPWDKVVGAGGETLAETYHRLTGSKDAWTVFRAMVDAKFPPGKPVNTDNPFRSELTLAADGGVSESFSSALVTPDEIAASTRGAVAAFTDVVKDLVTRQNVEPGKKPYLFPDGIGEIDFELKLGATQGFDLNIKVIGAKP